MKKLVFVFFMVLTMTSGLTAQLVVASPGTDSAIEAQTFLMSNLALQQQIKEYQYYVEYVSQFIEIIASVRNTTSTIKDISRIGSNLKKKTSKEWLEDVEKHISATMPEYIDLKNEVAETLGKSKKLMNGKYGEYVSRWDKESSEYHNKLVENYENHVMFPELFPAAQKLKENFSKSASSKKIIHKAWIESGLEYEMKNDIIRKNSFKKYYDEYMKQAKSNDNIEALGLANIMQSQYLTVEILENLRKNSDLKVMEEQFQKDASTSYLEMLSDRKKKEKMKNKPSEIFGLKRKKEKIK